MRSSIGLHARRRPASCGRPRPRRPASGSPTATSASLPVVRQRQRVVEVEDHDLGLRGQRVHGWAEDLRVVAGQGAQCGRQPLRSGRPAERWPSLHWPGSCRTSASRSLEPTSTLTKVAPARWAARRRVPPAGDEAVPYELWAAGPAQGSRRGSESSTFHLGDSRSSQAWSSRVQRGVVLGVAAQAAKLLHPGRHGRAGSRKASESPSGEKLARLAGGCAAVRWRAAAETRHHAHC